SAVRHFDFLSKRPARSCHRPAIMWCRSHFGICFGLTGESRRNLIKPRQFSWQEVLVQELSSYVFSPLREGDIALCRGSGTGLGPILLSCAEEGALGLG